MGSKHRICLVLLMLILMSCFYGQVSADAGTDSGKNTENYFLNYGDYLLGDSPWDLVTADFNGDGKKDLAVANVGVDPCTISVLLGNGDGTFQQPIDSITGGFIPRNPVSGDFNNDGRMDLVLTNLEPGNIAVLFGNGDGTFKKPILYPSQSYGRNLTVNDMNGDGFKDLAVTSGDYGMGNWQISVWLGERDGTFIKGINLDIENHWLDKIFSGDYNKDGKIDLLVSGGIDLLPPKGEKKSEKYDMFLFYGQGNGTFKQSQTELPHYLIKAVGDFKENGSIDLIGYTKDSQINDVKATLALLSGNGNGNFTPMNTVLNSNTEITHIFDVATGDFNADGHMDLVQTQYYDNKLIMMLGHGNGGFAPTADIPTSDTMASVAAGDYDEDGALDLAATNGKVSGFGKVFVLLNRVAVMKPVGIRAEAGDGQVSLIWNEGEDITGYNVKRATESGGPFATIKSNISEPYYTDTELSNGKPYYYVVSAIKDGRESANSKEVYVVPQALKPEIPGIPSGIVTAAGDTEVFLHWNVLKGALGYNIKRANQPNGPYITIADCITSPVYTDSGLVNSKTYFYVVSAVNEAGEGGNSKHVLVTPVSTAPKNIPAPKLKAEPDIEEVLLKWNQVSGALGFNVKRSLTKGGTYTIIAANATELSYIDTGLADDTTYFYVVSAVNKTYEGADSNEVKVKTKHNKEDFTIELSASAGDGQTVLVWIEPLRHTPESYTIKRSLTPRGTYTTIAENITGITFTDVGLNNGETYYYIISAIGADGGCTDSHEVSVTPQEIGPIVPVEPLAPESPVGLTAKVGNTAAFLHWDAAARASGYNVKRAVEQGGPYTTISNSITELAYADTGLVNGKTYYYVVTAVNEGGEGANSNEITAVLQEKPPVEETIKMKLKAKAGNSEVMLDWDEVAGATGYTVKRALMREGPYIAIASNVIGLAYMDTNLVNDTKYFYIVAAIIGGAEKARSNEVVAEPRETKKSLSIEMKIEERQGQVSLTWVELMPLDTNSYTVKRSETLGGPYISVGEDITERSYVDTELKNGIKYYYIVYAVKDGEEIAVSNEALIALRGNDIDVHEDNEVKQGDNQDQ